MKGVTQDSVTKWMDEQLHTKAPDRGKDNRGPDRVYEGPEGKVFAIEAIGFTESLGKRGQNQADFWKAFGQVISRLDPNSPWEKAHYGVIALPYRFLRGWSSRTREVGEDSWSRIGKAFPNLQIWFVSSEQIRRFTWSSAFTIPTEE